MAKSVRSSRCRPIGKKASLRVEKADGDETPVEEIDRDFAVLASLCAASEPANEDQLERALREARRQAKEQVRRRMGLA